MRKLTALLLAAFSAFANAAPAHLDVGDAHIIVIRPLDGWDPNSSTAEYSLKALRGKNFNFQYVDNSGALVAPSPGGWVSKKVSTPLSDEVARVMAENGFSQVGSHFYYFSRPVSITPDQMQELTRSQNELFRAAVVQQGDPSKLAGTVAAKKALHVLATALVAKVGVDTLGADTVSLSQYGTLHRDIGKLSGATRSVLLPVLLPEFDYSPYSEIELRRVTDNAGHVGEIVIAYRNQKTAAVEQNALAQAIAMAGGVGTTVEEVERARADDYARRTEIWTQCVATPGCIAK